MEKSRSSFSNSKSLDSSTVTFADLVSTALSRLEEGPIKNRDIQVLISPETIYGQVFSEQIYSTLEKRSSTFVMCLAVGEFLEEVVNIREDIAWGIAFLVDQSLKGSSKEISRSDVESKMSEIQSILTPTTTTLTTPVTSPDTSLTTTSKEYKSLLGSYKSLKAKGKSSSLSEHFSHRMKNYVASRSQEDSTLADVTLSKQRMKNSVASRSQEDSTLADVILSKQNSRKSSPPSFSFSSTRPSQTDIMIQPKDVVAEYELGSDFTEQSKLVESVSFNAEAPLPAVEPKISTVVTDDSKTTFVKRSRVSLPRSSRRRQMSEEFDFEHRTKRFESVESSEIEMKNTELKTKRHESDVQFTLGKSEKVKTEEKEFQIDYEKPKKLKSEEEEIHIGYPKSEKLSVEEKEIPIDYQKSEKLKKEEKEIQHEMKKSKTRKSDDSVSQAQIPSTTEVELKSSKIKQTPSVHNSKTDSKSSPRVSKEVEDVDSVTYLYQFIEPSKRRESFWSETSEEIDVTSTAAPKDVLATFTPARDSILTKEESHISFSTQQILAAKQSVLMQFDAEDVKALNNEVDDFKEKMKSTLLAVMPEYLSKEEPKSKSSRSSRCSSPVSSFKKAVNKVNRKKKVKDSTISSGKQFKLHDVVKQTFSKRTKSSAIPKTLTVKRSSTDIDDITREFLDPLIYKTREEMFSYSQTTAPHVEESQIDSTEAFSTIQSLHLHSHEIIELTLTTTLNFTNRWYTSISSAVKKFLQTAKTQVSEADIGSILWVWNNKEASNEDVMIVILRCIGEDKSLQAALAFLLEETVDPTCNFVHFLGSNIPKERDQRDNRRRRKPKPKLDLDTQESKLKTKLFPAALRQGATGKDDRKEWVKALNMAKSASNSQSVRSSKLKALVKEALKQKKTVLSSASDRSTEAQIISFKQTDPRRSIKSLRQSIDAPVSTLKEKDSTISSGKQPKLRDVVKQTFSKTTKLSAIPKKLGETSIAWSKAVKAVKNRRSITNSTPASFLQSMKSRVSDAAILPDESLASDSPWIKSSKDIMAKVNQKLTDKSLQIDMALDMIVTEENVSKILRSLLPPEESEGSEYSDLISDQKNKDQKTTDQENTGQKNKDQKTTDQDNTGQKTIEEKDTEQSPKLSASHSYHRIESLTKVDDKYGSLYNRIQRISKHTISPKISQELTKKESNNSTVKEKFEPILDDVDKEPRNSRKSIKGKHSIDETEESNTERLLENKTGKKDQLENDRQTKDKTDNRPISPKSNSRRLRLIQDESSKKSFTEESVKDTGFNDNQGKDEETRLTKSSKSDSTSETSSSSDSQTMQKQKERTGFMFTKDTKEQVLVSVPDQFRNRYNENKFGDLQKRLKKLEGKQKQKPVLPNYLSRWKGWGGETTQLKRFTENRIVSEKASKTAAVILRAEGLNQTRRKLRGYENVVDTSPEASTLKIIKQKEVAKKKEKPKFIQTKHTVQIHAPKGVPLEVPVDLPLHLPSIDESDMLKLKGLIVPKEEVKKYMAKWKIIELFQHMLTSVLAVRPVDPTAYLHDYIRRVQAGQDLAHSDTTAFLWNP